MPAGQALINLLQSTGAIALTGGQRPTFKVNFALLRAALQPEQAAMLAAINTAVQAALAAGTAPSITPALTQRTDTGTISLTPPAGGPAVNIPVIVLLGTDGGGSGPPTRPGFPRKGETVILDERGRNGHILIAAGGNAGYRAPGGNATVIGGSENLLVVLGGNGVSGLTGESATDGGDGICQGLGSGNDLYSQGGAGGTPGGTGPPGSPAVSGSAFVPSVPAGIGGFGGAGGNGGKAYVTGGDASYGLMQGGAGGSGGPAGAGGAGAPATTSLFGTVTVTPAVPPGAAGRPGDGGDGGNYHIALGQNSTIDPASSGGAPGAGAGAPAKAGAAGLKE